MDAKRSSSKSSKKGKGKLKAPLSDSRDATEGIQESLLRRSKRKHKASDEASSSLECMPPPAKKSKSKDLSFSS